MQTNSVRLSSILIHWLTKKAVSKRTMLTKLNIRYQDGGHRTDGE